MAIPENYENRILSGDIEANGFLYQATKVWCIVTQDVETEEMYSFHDFPELCGQTIVDPYDRKEYIIPERTGTLIEGARFWYKALNSGSKIAVHNGLGYDKHLVEKFWPKCITPVDSWVDTLIQSKIQLFDRGTPKGSKSVHGLHAWGCRFGINKPDITDWTKMDAFMLHRCIEDVKIQTRTHLYLEKERKAVREKLGITFDEAYQREAKYRINSTNQEMKGANVDQPWIDSCVAELDTLAEALRVDIEPQLPPTLKTKGGKVSLGEISDLLKLKRKLKDTYETVTIKGEDVIRLYKPFVKPTTTWCSTLKTTQYKGCHPTYGTSPVFEKKTLFNKWVKDTFPGTKPKDWDPQKTIFETPYLNTHTARHFGVKEEDIWEVGFIGGPFTKVEWHETKMSQHAKVKEFLLKLGWIPDEYNYKKDPITGGLMRDEKKQLIPTTPKLTESSFDTLPEGIGRSIANYNTYMHRRKFLENPDEPEAKGLKANIRDDGRVSCGVNDFGAASGRATHSVWVNAPSESALYGEKIRKVIVPSSGNVVVGADMKSAQLSIAAYFANNKDYYDAVADGEEEIRLDDGTTRYVGESGHCVNARAFTLVSESEWKEAIRTQDPALLKSIGLRRKKTKGGSFATIFGASGKKIAQTLGIPEQLGESKKKAFLQNIGLDRTIEILKVMVNKNKRGQGGYIELPFGFYVYCTQQHKLFNYLDQGTEAACQKWAVNYFEQECEARGYTREGETLKIIDYHDEFLCDVPEELATEVGELMCESYEKASIACHEWVVNKSLWFTGQDCPTFHFNLDGGYKVGNNYYEVH